MIGLYIRVSSAGQADKYSLPTQIQRGMTFAQKEEEEFLIYQDVVSGKNIQDRARFEDLLSDIRKGEVQKVWVIEQSRLNRNLEDALLVKRIFKEFNVRLFVDGSETELVTNEDSLKYNITSAISEYERSQIIARSVRGKTEWQDTGQMAYPSIYGYTYTYGAKGKKNWVVDEKEAETIKFIFREYVNEKAPINQIKLKLNDQGVKTKKGFAFSTSQIRAILKQPVYVGKIRNTKDELIKSEIYKPIVKDDIWELAQLELGRKQKSTNHFEQRPARYELSGVIKCGHCKASFHINEVTRPNRKGELHTIWKYYHSKQSTAAKTCKQNPRYLVRENVELQISNLVQSYFVDNDEMLGRWYRLHTTDLQREISQLELEVNSANLRLEAINKQKANLIDAITEGTLSKDDAKDKMIELNSVIRGLEIGIKEKGSTITLRKTESGSEYQMALVKLFRDFDVLTPVERRRLYQTIFKSVIIKDGKVTVTFFEGTKEKFLVDNHRKKK